MCSNEKLLKYLQGEIGIPPDGIYLEVFWYKYFIDYDINKNNIYCYFL